MNKSIVFDAGPVISLTLNNLLWLLEPLQREFRGSFYIPPAVKRELIDRPLATRKFKFEALQILPLIDNGTLEVVDNEKIREKAKHLVELANQCFKAKGNWISIIQLGEMEAIAAAMYYKSAAVVVDERITRMLIENPPDVRKTLQRRLHTKVHVNIDNLRKFNNEVKKIKVIRSIELVTIAYDLGLLNHYMGRSKTTEIRDMRKAVLEGVLWGVKMNGCSVSNDEIDEIIRIEKGR